MREERKIMCVVCGALLLELLWKRGKRDKGRNGVRVSKLVSTVQTGSASRAKTLAMRPHKKTIEAFETSCRVESTVMIAQDGPLAHTLEYVECAVGRRRKVCSGFHRKDIWGRRVSEDFYFDGTKNHGSLPL